ncbi:cysteine protease atg4da [Astyanax mexicanus]|uniref:Cysteine protease n=1 Tax=Astyanax mexicanus TaxID=7994 RepID=A0A8T2KZY8_ASTMX|nr:cysteine protease atg4da [Astyanax mexicanus]KAG9262606.1 cysteine protease ATG4D [Astyanax mexicanus]
MNSVSPSAAQYVGSGMYHDEPDGRRIPSTSAQVLEPRSHFGHGFLADGHREGSGEPDEVDRLKLRLMSAWNNVKYGWSVKTKTVFSKSSPLFLMGQSYQLNTEAEVERFRLAFGSRVWLTYRKEFPQLEGSSLTSDCGWGCMLRSGQMLLAQGLMVHFLPSDWRWPDCPQLTDVDFEVLRPRSPSRSSGISIPSFSSSWSSTVNQKQPAGVSAAADGLRRAPSLREPPVGREPQAEELHRRLVSWFGDQPAAPFGVHRLVELGKESGKRAGDWYGPSLVAHILRKAVDRSLEVPNLCVYVAQDCTVYTEDVKRLCDQSVSDSSSSSGSGWKSVIILVPVRLGGETLNPSYIECVKNILRLSSCIGIIGGKPKHSLFFIGFQDEQLLYLDPHYCQPVVDVTHGSFSLESFHCNSPRKMNFNRMDPSCTIGFYARSKKDFESLCSAVSVAVSSKERYPIFTFVEGRGQDYGLEGYSGGSTDTPTHIIPPGKLNLNKKRGSAEEFVFL